MVLVALIGVIALSSVALYYVVSTREANELVIEASLADAAGDYDVAIAQYTAALQKPLWNQQKALVHTNRGHVGVRERREVIRDLRSEFVQQRCELVAVVSEHVPGINVDDSRTEIVHHA